MKATFDPRTGDLRMDTPLFSCRRGRVGVRVGGCLRELRGPWRKAAGEFRLADPSFEARLSVAMPSAREARVCLTLTTSRKEGVSIEALAGLILPDSSLAWTSEPGRLIHYVYGPAWTQEGVKMLAAPSPTAPAFAKSETVTVLVDAGRRQALLIGALPGSSSITSIVPQPATPVGDGGVGLTVLTDIRAELRPGAAFTTGPLILLSGTDPLALLERYGDLWAELARPARKPVRVGWNSWDYYSGSVRREDVDENLAAGRAAFGGALKSWVIDEGWECQWGTWRPNWKFPQGLDDYCRHIREAGGEPGIWTAPLRMSVYSPQVRHHPDWFVCDAHGQPILTTMSYGTMGELDPTRADVTRWLGETYAELRRAGFRYFKLDFMDLSKADHFHDRTVTRGQALRKVYQTIRDAVGPEAYLMSSPHLEAGWGILDAARIGGDIHNFWGHIRKNAVNIAVSWWMHGRVWNNDPDFAIVRCAELSDDPFPNRPYAKRPLTEADLWMAGPEANLEECRTWLALCHLSGGDVILGDRLGALSDKGLALLRRVLTPLPEAARPLDLFVPGCPPRRWRARTPTGWLMGYFNWDELPETVVVDPRDWGGASARLVDFWTGQPLRGREPALALPPRHSRLIWVHTSDKPGAVRSTKRDNRKQGFPT